MKFDCHQVYSQTSSELFETSISHSNPETCRHSTGVPVSAYLKFFELERSPFDAKAQGQVVLGTRAIRDAFAAIESGIAEGASRICVNGGPGIGKTSLARALPKLLGGETESDAPNEGPRPFIWWLDRIQTLQLEFAPLPRDGAQPYIHKHLKRAGWQGPKLFSADAALVIHGYTGGVPSKISALCESMLIDVAAQNLSEIDESFTRGIFELEPISEIDPATDDMTNT
jgi:type II secretory pathway predicted ATPase ExeA